MTDFEKLMTLDVNDLRREKKACLDKVKANERKISTSDLNDDAKEALVGESDLLLDKAEWCETRAKAILDDEEARTDRRMAQDGYTEKVVDNLGRTGYRRPGGGRSGGGGSTPVGDGLSDVRNLNRNQQKRTDDGETYMDAESGKLVQVLSCEQSYRGALEAAGEIQTPRQNLSGLSASSGPEVPRVGAVVRSLITGDWNGVDMSMALAGGSNTGGGYFISPVISAEIIDQARSASVVMRAGARTVNMPNSELTLVKVDTDPTVSWLGENQQFSTTEPAFGRLTFRAKKLGVIVPISIELARDAPNSEDEIERLLSTVMALEIDRAALLGDSDGEEPRGVFNHPDVTENAIGGAVDWDDYLDSLQVILDANASEDGLSILYPPAVRVALSKLKVNSEANHYARAPMELDSVSRFTTTKLADSQSVIGDFRQVMVGVRSGVEIVATDLVAMADGSGFEKDQVLVKVRWRGDIQLAHGDHLETLTGIS